MNRVTIQLLSALVFSSSAVAEPLFDGETLAGWQSVGEASWVIEAGSIVASGSGDGYLYTDASYGDFELSAEFWVDATTNSGLYIRCTDPANIHPDTCYELNIWDEHPKPEARTGSIVFKVMPPLVHVETIGRWNTYEVSARGSSIIVKVNGQVTATMDDADPSPGFIALQHWAEGTVKFRNIELSPFVD